MTITITIAIDGGVVSATTVSPQSMTATSPQLPSLLTPAIGTMDAGAAPSEMELTKMVGLSSPSINQNIPVTKTGDMSAGAAPSEMELSAIAGLPRALVEQNIPIGGVGHTAAGAAPNFPATK